jgi:uncharacterized protein (TIGR02722 family)
MKHTLTILAFLPLFALSACSTVKYDDPDKVETMTIDFGSTDLQTMASDMVRSLNSAPQLAYLENPSKTSDKRIVMFMGGVNNRTTEHIDTEGITDSIRSALLQDGRFRFVASPQGQDQLGEQVRFQQGSGRVDPAQARSFGKQLGAEVVLYGTLRSIEKSKGRSIESGLQKKQDVWYQFVLECSNIETGEIIWSNIKELRKTEKKSLFG